MSNVLVFSVRSRSRSAAKEECYTQHYTVLMLSGDTDGTCQAGHML